MTDRTKLLTDRRMNDQHRALRGATRMLAATTLGLTSLTCAAAVVDGAFDGTPGPVGDGRIELEEIVVTAEHRTEKLRDVPMGITALSGDYLDQRQDRSF